MYFFRRIIPQAKVDTEKLKETVEGASAEIAAPPSAIEEYLYKREDDFKTGDFNFSPEQPKFLGISAAKIFAGVTCVALGSLVTILVKGLGATVSVKGNAQKSQTWMRMRVGVQGATVLLLASGAYVFGFDERRKAHLERYLWDVQRAKDVPYEERVMARKAMEAQEQARLAEKEKRMEKQRFEEQKLSKSGQKLRKRLHGVKTKDPLDK